MVALQLPSIGLGHFLIARSGLGLEYPVSLLELTIARCGRAAHPLGSAAGLCARHRLDVHHLQGRDTERGSHAAEELTHRALEIVAPERCAHLDLDEDPSELRTATTGAGEGRELTVHIV